MTMLAPVTRTTYRMRGIMPNMPLPGLTHMPRGYLRYQVTRIERLKELMLDWAAAVFKFDRRGLEWRCEFIASVTGRIKRSDRAHGCGPQKFTTVTHHRPRGCTRGEVRLIQGADFDTMKRPTSML